MTTTLPSLVTLDPTTFETLASVFNGTVGDSPMSGAAGCDSSGRGAAGTGGGSIVTCNGAGGGAGKTRAPWVAWKSWRWAGVRLRAGSLA